MRICRQHGKWLYEWDDLSPELQEQYIEVERQRMEKVGELNDWLVHTDKDGNNSIDGVAYTLLRLFSDLL